MPSFPQIQKRTRRRQAPCQLTWKLRRRRGCNRPLKIKREMGRSRFPKGGNGDKAKPEDDKVRELGRFWSLVISLQTARGSHATVCPGVSQADVRPVFKAKQSSSLLQLKVCVVQKRREFLEVLRTTPSGCVPLLEVQSRQGQNCQCHPKFGSCSQHPQSNAGIIVG